MIQPESVHHNDHSRYCNANTYRLKQAIHFKFYTWFQKLTRARNEDSLCIWLYARSLRRVPWEETHHSSDQADTISIQ